MHAFYEQPAPDFERRMPQGFFVELEERPLHGACADLCK